MRPKWYQKPKNYIMGVVAATAMGLGFGAAYSDEIKYARDVARKEYMKLNDLGNKIKPGGFKKYVDENIINGFEMLFPNKIGRQRNEQIKKDLDKRIEDYSKNEKKD